MSTMRRRLAAMLASDAPEIVVDEAPVVTTEAEPVKRRARPRRKSRGKSEGASTMGGETAPETKRDQPEQ